jgi:alkylation response protein AidB-like acyl-CoA dehydrogenase
MSTAPESPNREDLLERARALADVFRQEAAASEQGRRPTEKAVRALVDSGVLDLMLPVAFGGPGLDLEDFMEVGLVLGESDASLGWVANFLIEHVWWFAQFPEAFQKEIYAAGAPMAAGVIAPSASVRRVDGGIRIEGRWGWASGITCSDWLLAGGLEEIDGGIQFTLAALSIDDIQVLDTWDVAGMCGTGSNDVVAKDVFVPEERTLSFMAMINAEGPGACLHDDPLQETPALPILMMAVATTALGQARAAYTRFREDLATKVRGAGPPEREKPGAQIHLATAALELRKAELLLADVVRDVQEKRNRADGESRARWFASYSEVSHMARDVVLELARTAGASAQFRSHPLQRTVRDVNTLCTHVALDRGGQRENLGRILLGLPSNSPL